MTYSAQRVARSSDTRRRRALALWWLQLGLNAAWTAVFFGARGAGAGAADVICTLLPAVAATAAASARVDRPAGLLYAPYLAWSTYAAALNLEIWRRNRCPRRSCGAVAHCRSALGSGGMEDRALRRGNALLAVLHAAQAAVILALSTDFSLPVTGAFMEGQPGSGLPTQDLLFDLRIGPLVGAFLLLAALDHASGRASAVPHPLREVPRCGCQPLPLARVLAVGVADGRPDRDADRRSPTTSRCSLSSPRTRR